MRYDGHRGEIWRGNRLWEAGDLKFHQFFFYTSCTKRQPCEQGMTFCDNRGCCQFIPFTKQNISINNKANL